MVLHNTPQAIIPQLLSGDTTKMVYSCEAERGL
jgi:hypothetical protein